MNLRFVLPLACALALAGCQTEIPVCVEESPQFEKEFHACRNALPGLYVFLSEGGANYRCEQALAKKGIYPRNRGTCYSPEVIDFYKRKFNELPPNIKLPPGDQRAKLAQP